MSILSLSHLGEITQAFATVVYPHLPQYWMTGFSREIIDVTGVHYRRRYIDP